MTKGTAQRPGRPDMGDGLAALHLGKYPQLERQFFSADDGLPDDFIKGVAVQGQDRAWIGTKAGLAAWSATKGIEKSALSGTPDGEVRFVQVDSRGRAWAGFADGVYRLRPEGQSAGNNAGRDTGEGIGIASTWQRVYTGDAFGLAEDGTGRIYMATDDGLFSLGEDDKWYSVAGKRPFETRGIAAYGEGNVILATNQGLKVLFGKNRTEQVDGPSRSGWKTVLAKYSGSPSDDLRDVAADKWGHLWIATDSGVAIHDDLSHWRTLTGEDGLPCEDVRTVAFGPKGERWFGTALGAARLHEGRWTFLGAERWLPHPVVTAIAIADDGTVWVGTEKGLSRITTRMMRLEDKAYHYDALVQKYHLRHNYVVARNLSEKGNPASGSVATSDNDGLWTALYMASQVYRYGVTGEEQAKKYARRSLEALLKLARISGRPGFTARAIRHKSEPAFGTPHPEWHLTPDGEWEWKGDTSSDEMVGHFYGYFAYYRFLANDKEREDIRQVVSAIVDHMLDHGLYLVDVDGRPTTWAVWAPEKLNLEDRWYAERGCNSLEILSFLKVAHDMTENPRYEQAYNDLVGRHHYAMNVIDEKQFYLGRVSHIDDQLAFLSYLPLLTLETDPDIRALYLMGLERHWQYERPEHSPVWNAIYGALTGRWWDGENAVRSLAEMPLDLIQWRVTNSGRADIKLDDELLAYGYKQAAVAPSVIERPLRTSNPYELDGGNGMRMAAGTTLYLHPYWLARFWGLIVESGD